MKTEFRKNKNETTNNLVVDGVVTHSKKRMIILNTYVSKDYKRFEKKLDKKIGKKLRMVDTKTGDIIEGYYFGLCENVNKPGASYFFANSTRNELFDTIPYGIINEFTYEVVKG